MIFVAEILFLTISVVVVLGSVVYLLHRPGKRDTGEDYDPKSGEPHL